MISLLITVGIQIFLSFGLIWLIVALLAARWRNWQPIHRGYVTLLRVLLLETARWLWMPRFEREGGGQMAQPYISSQDEERLWD
ncbi:MAG TPA: hypothetical protein VFA32_19305 [Dehalococcoidia bacterium]|jgi:hypothetical protein|nr:hypothetical protein [Dehalococcoidia bacterium]